MSRAAMFNLVAGVTQNTDAVYENNSIDTPQQRPFVNLRWEEKPKSFGFHGRERMSIRVHDEPGSYDRIRQSLDEIRDAVTSAVHVDGGDGETITQCDWEGRSADLYDDGFGTITKYDTYTVVSRPT